MIYFMRCCEPEHEMYGHVKIGKARVLVNRKRQLEQEFGQLSVLGVMPGSYQEEAATHKLFAHLRVKSCRGRGREWFRLTADLMQYILDNATMDTAYTDSIDFQSSYVSYIRSRLNGMSVATLSQKTGINYQRMSKLCRGGFDSLAGDEVEILCDFFSCGIDDLFALNTQRGTVNLSWLLAVEGVDNVSNPGDLLKRYRERYRKAS